MNSQQLVYAVDTKRKMFPLGSVIIVVANLIWLGFTNDSITAMALIISFGMLAVLEFLIHWSRANSHYGVKYALDNQGFTATRGSTTKRYEWHQFKGFFTEYQAKFGDYISLIPLGSFFFSPEEKYKLYLYTEKAGGAVSAEEQPIYLMTTPMIYDKVVAFIQQFIPFQRQKIGFGTLLWSMVILFSIIGIVAVIITLMLIL